MLHCGFSTGVNLFPDSVDNFSTSAKLHLPGGTMPDGIAGLDRIELFSREEFIFHLRLTKGLVAVASAPLSECFLDAPFLVPSSVLSTISAHRISCSCPNSTG